MVVEPPRRDKRIQLLGGLKVLVAGTASGPPKFRSKTSEKLLALLALRIGNGISKSELGELLWPESDGDRQAQNLRKALSDVRQAIETGPSFSPSILGSTDRLWLDPEAFDIDVREFRRLTDAGLDGIGKQVHLRNAITMYSGPLLAEYDDSWLLVHRLELEERFGQAVDQMITFLLKNQSHDEALRIGRQAVVAAPLREDVHLALVCAYASGGLLSEAIRQFEELERLLNDRWGEKPSPKSIETFESLWKTRENIPTPDPGIATPLNWERSGGAVPIRSSFYIDRESDKVFCQAIERGEGTILVHGPRQVGKTSLVYRNVNRLRSMSRKIAITDFQIFNRSQLENAETFSRALAYGFAAQLGVPVNFEDQWNEWIGPNSNLHAVVEFVLGQVDASIVWTLDEADRVFSTDFSDDFFGLIRSWHNLRAADEFGPFGRLTVVISYATEARLFIRDINQSPFNVGIRIPMNDFNLAETFELSCRYGLKLNLQDVRRIWDLTHGQPFLTRRAFDTMVHDETPLQMLEHLVCDESGPFGDHLMRVLSVAERDDQTKAEVIRFLQGLPFLDPKTPLRLVAGGLIVARSLGGFEFRVPIYGQFLGRYLMG